MATTATATKPPKDKGPPPTDTNGATAEKDTSHLSPALQKAMATRRATAEARKDETKHDKFTRIARTRMSRFLQTCDALVVLSKSTYESTQSQRDKIVESVRVAAGRVVKEFEQAGQGRGERKKSEFEF